MIFFIFLYPLPDLCKISRTEQEYAIKIFFKNRIQPIAKRCSAAVSIDPKNEVGFTYATSYFSGSEN
jgi:hypothetical protein